MNLKNISKKTIVSIATVAIVVAGLIVGLFSLKSNSSPPAGQPEYQTVLPSNRTINQLGGWQRISPPEGEPVFAYSDEIDGVTISVSQQPLPSSFQNNIDSRVAETAKSFNATTKIDSKETTIYQGTSAKGPQYAIFTKNNLLILIKADQKIKDQSWIDYVQLLRPGGADGEVEIPEY